MRAALLAVALLGCGGGSELRRGSPVPVPMARPQQGPRVGPLPPGRQAAPLPRSPNTRHLPPQAAPGVWASDGPRASAAADELLGVILPPLEGAPNGLNRECAADMGEAVRTAAPDALRAKSMDDVQRTVQQRTCLAARLYNLCVQRALAGTAHREAMEAAEDYARRKCPKAWNTPEVERLFHAVRRALMH